MPKTKEEKTPLREWKYVVTQMNKQVTEVNGGEPTFEQLEKYLSVAIYCLEDYPESLEFCLGLSKYVKTWAEREYVESKDARYWELYWKAVLWESPYQFESFLLYMERDRKPKKKFYSPRRRALRPVVQDLQDLEDGKLKFLGVSLPPRVGKSTLCIFFMAWVIGRHPSSHNAMSGHSGILADRFYRDIIKLTSDGEYNFKEIFPKVKIISKSADKNEIFFDKSESFATMTCRGIDGTWTGAVDISSDGYLYVDDMIRDRTESMSQQRLENRYQDYLNVLVDRKNDGSKELMVGTRWNVLDPLGRVESTFKNNPAYRFRKIPALNEKDESNFQYNYGVGFTTEYYKEMREKLDKNEWMAKYQQRPFVREGLVFPEDELRTFNGVLPEGDHRIVSACDVAWGGGDATSMPVGYEYENGDVYITKWMFDRGKKEVTIPKVTSVIVDNEIRQLCVEANNGGELYASNVSANLKEAGYKCSITSKRAPARMEKMSKIMAYSGTVIRNFVFLDREHQDSEYKEAFEELVMITADGKNIHDDSADSIVQLAMTIDSHSMASVKAVHNPFMRSGLSYYG